ncbi:hypothetical protein FE392_13260 [Xenorhabdus sp. 12]|uniref:Teneurin-like YD-shell domain-containing protein n=1 Tax=Xenorhabdus santafensis TaxID=2582833 RepID=A0ABU4SBX8_9GAMM|nr:RHS repeat-associated core domain-containing protein [Xenorhabdus sp. 12]MDX7988289.1 hypothetical protein [Xenorhabdus sp. 12]
MNNTFFSHANNFQSAVTSGVDPRTGLFNYSLLATQLNGNNGLGPSLTLALSYNPLNTKNIGFGIGFTHGLTQYDRKNQLLMLSSGERYKVTETDNSVSLRQYKLDVVRFEKDTKQNVYRVIHKSGQIEVLTGAKNAYDLKVPIKILTPLGHFLKLDWDFQKGVRPYLISVSDETQTLLTVHYEFGSYTKITVWPGTSESHELKLLFQNEYVKQIKNSASGQTLEWALGYSDDQFCFLNKITSPTGLIERVQYTPDGQQFPDNAHLLPLPYVQKYTQFPAHGEPIIRTYRYTKYNFLGYGTSGHWDPDSDNLYGVMSSYQYGSTEIWHNGNDQRLITRRYNNFHLMVSESIQQNECKREHRTEYYAKVGILFEKQDPRFQMPTSATILFNDATDGDVVQTEFDEAGNLTKQTMPDGTCTEWEYYDVNGEGDDCPTSPYGFKRFLKSKTVTPGLSFPEGAYDDAPVHKTTYRYSRLPTCKEASASYAVVCTYEGHFVAGQLLRERQTYYVNEVDSPEHGRIQQIKETLHPISESTSPVSASSEKSLPEKTVHSSDSTKEILMTLSYTLKGEALIQDIQTNDGKHSFKTQSTQSRFSNKVLGQISDHNSTSHYSYDGYGRLLNNVNNQGTDYAQDVHYSYAIEQDGGATTVKTDLLGNQLRTYFDGLGQPYRQQLFEQGKENQDWWDIAEIERDSWGRVIKQTCYDWLPVDGDLDSSVQVSSRQSFEYDDWGQQSRIVNDTGGSTQQDYDPVTRTLQVTMQVPGMALGKRTVVYDKRHQPVITTLYDAQGRQHSQQTNHYDGLGRLRATIDESNQKTEMTYDLFGRISTITLSDGTVVRKSYDPLSSGNLVTQIKVNDHILGTRQFDRLGRVISTNSGGRAYQYTYEGKNPYPSQIEDPLHNIATYAYDPLLDYSLTQMSANDIQHRFVHDLKTGNVTQANSVQQTTHDFHYSPSGRLQQDTFRFDDTKEGIERQENFTYSPAGKLTVYQDITGKKRQVAFDKFGRSVTASDPDIDMRLTYDGANRVNGWSVQDKQSGKQLTVTLAFDDFGREIRREIRTEKETLTLEQTYTIKGQLASRTTNSQHAGLLRQENYTYDPVRHWLTEYGCTGAEQPLDAYGFAITHQRFTYDFLGNILTCLTTLADGSDDKAVFTYSPLDPCQLSKITHTHPKYPATIVLEYDKAGRLTKDEAGRHLTYDALGRLIKVEAGEMSSHYAYDAQNRLVLQKLGEDNIHELYYQGQKQIAEITRGNESVTRFLRAQGTTVATATDNEVYMLGTDHNSSVLTSYKRDGTQTHYRYSPYGQQNSDERDPAIPAYNGERVDKISGAYHLGNGYRAYNPVLMRFNAPDSESPFGVGGFNTYAYCLGDPINHIDPSGHMSPGSIFGLVFGTVGLAVGVFLAIPTGGASLSISGAILAGIGLASDVTGIASAVLEDSDPKASSVLGWVSLGLGVATIAGGAISFIKGLQQAKRMADSFGTVYRSEIMTHEGMPVRTNMMEPSAGPSEYMHGIDNEPVRRFKEAVERRMIVPFENPPRTGVYTLGFNSRGPGPLNSDFKELKQAFFTARRGNIAFINNVYEETGIPYYLNITQQDFELLYLTYAGEDIFNPIGNSQFFIRDVNSLRTLLDTHIHTAPMNSLTNSEFQAMQETWARGHFTSEISLEGWVCTMLGLRYRNLGSLIYDSRINGVNVVSLFNNIIEASL